MNSIQLISKLKSKADDLNLALGQVTGGTYSVHTIEKEVLKKNCIELYELILKLKTEEENQEEKPEIKPIIHAIMADAEPIKPIEKAPVPEEKIPEPSPLPEFSFSMPDFEHTLSFNKTLENLNQEELSLNNLEESIEEKVEIEEISKPITLFEIAEEIPSKKEIQPELASPAISDENSSFIPEPKVHHESIEAVIPGYQPIEINIEKVVENKRIQKTVLPDIEPIKPKGGLNDILAGKMGTNRNETFGNTQNNQANPFNELPIENIKSEINLNKKIAFVNDLFGENVVDYAKAIDRLNNANGINEALVIFGEYKNQYNWKQDNELVGDLERLLRRRHRA